MLFPLPIAPLPQDLQEKDSSEPFPCQNRLCGCRSAEQCWKKCCCFNNGQKVAWAKANKVKVPDFVLAAAKKEDLTCEVAKSTCCHKAKTPTIAKSHCCGSCASSVEKPPASRKRPASSKWVMAVYASEFQGQGPPAFCFPISIIPDRLLLVTPSVAVVESFLHESERLQQASLRPPLPPPKIV